MGALDADKSYIGAPNNIRREIATSKQGSSKEVRSKASQKGLNRYMSLA